MDRGRRTVLCLLFILAWSQLGFPKENTRQVVDATQVAVTTPESPQRIVTLVPSLGELVADLLGKQMDRLIGVSEYTDYPPELKKRESIGSYQHFNIEKIVSFKPDLVFGTMDGNQTDQVKHLREFGIPTVIVNTESFEEIGNSMRLVGRSLGVAQSGIQMAQQFETGLKDIKKKYVSLIKKRVLLQVGDDPLVVAGEKSFLNDALEWIGATNVYGNQNSRYPHPSIEDVIRLNPEVIVIAAMGDEVRLHQNMKKKWMEFKSIQAVQKNQVFIIRSDALLRPTLRFLEGLSQLAKVIHGK